MDHTPGPSGEQGTEEMPETAEEKPVLLPLRVRFQDDFLSQVIKATEDWSFVYLIEFVSFGF